MPSAEEVEKTLRALGKSVPRFNDEQRTLLVVNASERAMTHKFAEILCEELRKEKLENWDIDCEYNRCGAEGEPKIVSLCRAEFLSLLQKEKVSAEEAFEMLTGDGSTSIFPDIIVHRRTKQENLIAIEAKKVGVGVLGKAERIARQWDAAKLRLLSEEHAYALTAQIEFNVEGYTTRVIR